MIEAATRWFRRKLGLPWAGDLRIVHTCFEPFHVRIAPAQGDLMVVLRERTKCFPPYDNAVPGWDVQMQDGSVDWMSDGMVRTTSKSVRISP